MKIAIIGTGISGLGAAWLLNDLHDITVYEKASRLGGHSNTVEVDYDGVSIPVDTGFIVYNELNYPNLTALFKHLGVATEESNMSFAFSTPNSSVEWCGDNLNTIFTYRRNALRPRFLSMLTNIIKFNRLSFVDLMAGKLSGLSLGEYLESRGYSSSFREQYLLPMGAAIWSTSLKDMLAFPAASFVQFFTNHRLINSRNERPQWRTVTGGSREYVKWLSSSFVEKIHLNSKLIRVMRDAAGVIIKHADGHTEKYDQVIFACHSNEALELLGDPSHQEEALLGAIKYEPNKVILHRDSSLMPRRQKAWASWNYMRESDGSAYEKPASVTYWMNRLQNIDKKYPLFVSLNPAREPDPDLTFASLEYMHPLYNKAALAAQKQLDVIQGIRDTWFCGAYFGYGFHEDGLISGLNVAERLGAKRPWDKRQMPSASAPIIQAAE